MTTLVALATKDALIMGCDSLGTVTRQMIDPMDLLKFFDSNNEFNLKLDKDGKPSIKFLKEMEEKSKKDVLNQISERNSRFFDNEVDKLDKWTDDIKESLEIELKKLSKEIKTLKTEARKIVRLDEKVKAQRRIKDMEKKRNGMRLNLFKLQDEADERKEKLIEEIEGRLKQKIKQDEIFRIRWRVE